MSSLESPNNTNVFMNLDGNVTPESLDVDTSHEESKWCYPRAAALTLLKEAAALYASSNSVPPLNPPPSRVDVSDAEGRQKQRWMEDEDTDETVEILKQIKIRASLEARCESLLEQIQESVGAPLIPVERNRKKKKKSRYQQHSRN